MNKKIHAVIFDLDGTLTEPVLDFDLIRSEIGQISGPILEAMDKMAASQRQRAEEILRKHERLAVEQSRLNPGVHEVMDWLRQHDKRIGLFTRNQRESVETFCRMHHLVFDGIVTREDGPYKPDPFPVACACQQMRVRAEAAVVVGDYVFDLMSGRRAGARTVLLGTHKSYQKFTDHADFVILNLAELPGVIENLENSQFCQSRVRIADKGS
ncbi:MAG: Pyrophosphatase PpaX [Planctomycetes bacterium ADurb.Bin412]|nr:MAG: Pyrophosphatase PpaX [Planctomycetes bacterium ADurb.Bin412]